MSLDQFVRYKMALILSNGTSVCLGSTMFNAKYARNLVPCPGSGCTSMTWTTKSTPVVTK